jgi:hypothetical protein
MKQKKKKSQFDGTLQREYLCLNRRMLLHENSWNNFMNRGVKEHFHEKIHEI